MLGEPEAEISLMFWRLTSHSGSLKASNASACREMLEGDFRAIPDLYFGFWLNGKPAR
jgi:hypothetical protein